SLGGNRGVPVARVVRLSPRFLSRLQALGVVRGSSASMAVGRVVQALGRADVLPGPGDYEAAIPPTSRAWVRRVPGENLWLFYRATEEAVSFHHPHAPGAARLSPAS